MFFIFLDNFGQFCTLQYYQYVLDLAISPLPVAHICPMVPIWTLNPNFIILLFYCGFSKKIDLIYRFYLVLTVFSFQWLFFFILSKKLGTFLGCFRAPAIAWSVPKVSIWTWTPKYIILEEPWAKRSLSMNSDIYLFTSFWFLYAF